MVESTESTYHEEKIYGILSIIVEKRNKKKSILWQWKKYHQPSKKIKYYVHTSNMGDEKRSDKKYVISLVDNVRVLTENRKMVIPNSLKQHRIVAWYYHYLQHPGHDHLEETIRASMTWKGLRETVIDTPDSVHNVKSASIPKRSMGNFQRSM